MIIKKIQKNITCHVCRYFSINIKLFDRIKRITGFLRSNRGLVGAFACVVAYVIWASEYSILRYVKFEASAFDLGIYAQGVWLISHGYYPFFDTVRGLPIFGDHATLILLLIAPLYRLCSRPEFLLIIQTVALGVGGLAAYLVAASSLRSQWLALVITIAYLLYAPVEWMNFWDFHPDIFATPFLLFAILSLHRRRWIWFWLNIVCALGSKETVGMAVGAFGLYVWAVTGWRKGSIVVLLGAFWTFFDLKLIQYFNGGVPSAYISDIYGQYGRSIPSILEYIVTHPILIFHQLLNEQNVLYIGEFLYPLAYLPFAAPEILPIMVPIFFINLLSASTPTHYIQYQYTAPIVPFMILGTIIGMNRCREWLRYIHVTTGYSSFILGGMLLACSIYGWVTISPCSSLQNDHFRMWPKGLPIETSRIFEKELRGIPVDASISAQAALIPHLSNRSNIYMFPNPFVQLAWGNSVQALKQQQGNYDIISSVNLALQFSSIKVDYIAIAPRTLQWPLFKSDQDRYVMNQLFLSSHYGVIYAQNGLIILKRGANHRKGLEQLHRMQQKYPVELYAIHINKSK